MKPFSPLLKFLIPTTGLGVGSAYYYHFNGPNPTVTPSLTFNDSTRGLSPKKVHVNEYFTALSGPKKMLQREFGAYTKLTAIPELKGCVPKVYGVVDGSVEESLLNINYADKVNSKDDHLLILIETIPGKLLTEVLRDPSVNTSDKMDVIKKVDTILDIMHKNNFRHHDPGPHNIMVRPSGDPVLIDFADSCSCDHPEHFLEEKSRFNLRCISELLGTKVFDPLKSKEYQENFSGLSASECHRY